MSCVLVSDGSEFSVDSFLQESDLVPCAVYRKGEPPRFPASQPQGKVHKSSGFSVDVSGADFDNLKGQIQDAISFMKQHKPELERLCKFPGVEEAYLDFGIWARTARRDVAVQMDYFPPELLYLAGSLGIGIMLSLYRVDRKFDGSADFRQIRAL